MKRKLTTEQKLRKVIRRIIKEDITEAIYATADDLPGKPIYKPYKGMSGPDEKQTANNLKALAVELDKLGIPYIIDNDYMLDLTGDIEETVLRLEHPVNKRPMYVSYDRWGYVLDGDDDLPDIDQADLKTTVAALKNIFSNKSITTEQKLRKVIRRIIKEELTEASIDEPRDIKIHFTMSTDDFLDAMEEAGLDLSEMYEDHPRSYEIISKILNSDIKEYISLSLPEILKTGYANDVWLDKNDNPILDMV